MEKEIEKDVEVTPVAYKSKSTVPMLICGSAFLVGISVLACIFKFKEFFVGALCLMLLALAFIFAAVLDLKRPDVVVQADNKCLHVFQLRKWKIIEITSVTNVSCKHTLSGTIVLKSGTITILTGEKKYNVYNVSNVDEVCKKLVKLCLIKGE